VIGLYFAYGSNMHSPRLLERVPGARPRGVARLLDHAMRCNKLGDDGSAKANLVACPGDLVWGVVYELEWTRWPQLDAWEPGYDRMEVRVVADGESAVAAQTYVSRKLTDDERSHAWYRELMVCGAEEHGLPAAYRERLRRLRVLDLG